jgi:hypothetical protein
MYNSQDDIRGICQLSGDIGGGAFKLVLRNTLIIAGKLVEGPEDVLKVTGSGEWILYRG